MKPRIAAAALLVCASLVTGALAEPGQPATRPAGQARMAAPATQPTTQPAAIGTMDSFRLAIPSTRPAKSQPTTQPGQASFPTPQELAAQWKARHDAVASQAKVVYIDLNQPLVERPAEFALFGDNSLTLHSVLDRLRQSRVDKDVRAVLINIGATEFNLAQAQEIRDSLVQLRKAGKKTFVYADAYDTAGYILASGATDVCMLGGGEIMIPGVGLETMFAKGLLDKVGIKADYVQIGQYKGADEQYTRTEPSAEMRGELNKILDSLYGQIIEGISYHRNIPRSNVEEMINNVMVGGKLAKERRFVDHLLDQDGLRELMKKELGREVNLLADYGLPERTEIDWSNPFALMGSLMKPAAPSTKPAVALIYAEGVIVDGMSEESLFGGGGTIGSENLRRALRVASRDDNIHAIVLRIDSPGGSAMASEVMWQAARRASAEKPLIISIGSMAASGGYYLASAGDHVFADQSAIVGSIGVVGGKFVTKDLFEKVGLTTETFTRGTNADLFSSAHPFTDRQRRLVTNWMQQTYDQFTDRILTTRKQKIGDINEIAHGRIFLAKEARTLGMVDELGGLDDAISHAAAAVELEPGKYDVKVLPATRTLGDLLRGGGAEATMPFRPQVNIGQESLLRALSPSAGRQMRQQLQVLQLLQKRPVMLVAPYTITVK